MNKDNWVVTKKLFVIPPNTIKEILDRWGNGCTGISLYKGNFILWDRDRDTRIFTAVDMYLEKSKNFAFFSEVMTDVFFMEYEGNLTIYTPNRFSFIFNHNKEEYVDVEGDSWLLEIVDYENDKIKI